MAEAFTYEWDVSPHVIAEVRHRTLYPFKPAGPETEAEMTENPPTVFGAAFHDSEPVGCIAVLDEPKHITSPVIYELVTRFELVVNIRQAEVRDEIGIVCLELEGSRVDLKKATKWLERKGIKVEPVEINVIES